MEKLIYLVWLTPDTTPDQVAETMLGQVAPELLGLGPTALTMDLDDGEAQISPPMPLPDDEDPVRALVSIWLPNADERHRYEEVLDRSATRIAGYLVSESLYDDYGTTRWSGPRTWPDGQRSPGVLTVTLFEKPERFDDDAEWYDFWHTRQSPMSAEVQPRCRYVRNSVFRAVTSGAPPWRGIVEEAWAAVDDVTDPMRFYCADGDPEVMNANLSTMLDHVTHFLDLDHTRVHTMSEYPLRSAPWDHAADRQDLDVTP
jgi:hypothetical protein